jgi:hypothetical protein
MKKITINDIRNWLPWHDPNHYLAESWEGTALDILNEKRIPFQDRLWVIMRTDLVSEKLMRKFAVWCARQVQHLMTDSRSIHALDVMEAYVENCWLIDDPDYVEAWEKELTAAQIAAEEVELVAVRIAPWATAVAGNTAATASAAASAASAAVARDVVWAARGVTAAALAAFAAVAGSVTGAAMAASVAAARGVSSAVAAAEDAAWTATWSATLNAAYTAQEQKLREMLIEGIKTGDTK